MTSEARHPTSPAPVVSVKARAQEIEARSGTGAKTQVQAGISTTPVARQETALSPKKYQATAPEESTGRSGEDLPSRRCSEGDIFQHCKVRQPPPTAPRPRRVSLENATLPAVPERRSTLGRLAESSESSCTREPPSHTKTTSKFTPFTAGGKGGVTNSQAAAADFSPAIFSPNRLHTQTKPSPLDDIITALEKICDEFSLPEDHCRRYSADHQLETSSLPRGYDDVFEKCVRRTSSAKSNHNANDKSQWLSEHGVSQVDECQKIKPDATGKSSEAKVLPDGSQSVKHSSPRRADSVGAESIVYRSGVVLSPKSNERHVVSATLFVSPPKVAAKCESGKSVYSSPSKFVSDAGKAEINTGTIAKGEKAHHVKTTSENGGGHTSSLKSSHITSNLQSKFNEKNVSIESKVQVKNVERDCQTPHTKHNTVKFSEDELKKDDTKRGKDEITKIKKPVACKPDIPKIFSNSLSLKDKSLSVNNKSNGKDENERDDNPSEELEIVRNILANLDFQKYKRRSSLDEMESKSPKPPRAQKATSAKFKDLFDLLKPSSDTSSSSKRPFGLCRSSSFSDAETIASDKEPPNFFVQNEENDAITPLPEDKKKISTLPRRKSPSQLFTKSISKPAPVPAVASCPSIVKLENRVALNNEIDLSHDEGLVSDSEVGPGAYVTAYVSCVTSSPKQASGRRGHVRSASDNVTSGTSTALPEVRIKKTSSTEKLWFSVTSRLNGTEKQRKRRKGVGCKQTMGDEDQESVKSGRSLTYPPQRKSSTSEEEQEFTSVDSNGLKSLKHQTVGLMDSSSDAVRLLSDLSLADSHLCPSEGTIEETYLDVVDSVIHSPSDPQHLSVDESSAGTSSKSHKKKHHSDPGGEAGSNSSGDGFIAEVIVGLVRSEPDLGSNETGVTANSSSCSSASSETSSRATQTPHFDDERPTPLKLIIDGPRNAQGTKHTRGITGGSLTSGATSSRFHFPETDISNQRLAIEQNQSSKSPQEQRRYSKRRLRGPYGEMLEEEMRKSGEKQKSVLNDLSFLQDIVDTGTKNQDASSNSETSSQSQNRPAMFVSSQSLDDASSMSSRNELSMCVTPKRKISANYPLLTDGESVAIASDEDISPTKPPTPNELVANNDIVRNESNTEVKNECQQKNKDDVKGLPDFAKIQERHSSDGTSPPRDDEAQQADGRLILRRLCAAMGLAGIEKLDTRTHVVAELYDTEKSYVESLQIIAHMLCIKLNLLSSLATNLFFFGNLPKFV